METLLNIGDKMSFDVLYFSLKKFQRFVSLATPSRGRIVTVAICYLVITCADLVGLGALFLFLNNYFMDDFEPLIIFRTVADFEGWVFLVTILIIWTVKFFLVLIANFFIVRFSQDIASKIRTSLVRSVYCDKPPRTSMSDKAVWFDTVSRQLSFSASSILEPAMRAIFDCFLIIAMSLYLLFFAAGPFLAILGWILIAVFGMDFLVRKKIIGHGNQFNKISEGITTDLKMLTDGADEFWLMQQSKSYFEKTNNSMFDLIKHYSIFSTLSILPRFFLELVLVFGVVGTLWYSEIFGVPKQEVIITTAILAFAGLRMIPLVNSVNVGINQLRTGARTIENVISISEIAGGAQSLEHCPAEIRKIVCQGLSLNLSGKAIFEKVSLDLKFGQTILVRGVSGSGKTSFVKCLLGLMPISSGTIQFVDDFGRTAPTRHSSIDVGYVPQKPTLLNGTVRENLFINTLDFAKRDAALNNALAVSGFGDILEQLPDGLDTQLGRCGVSLSGGQVAKLALARALLNNNGLIVCDEPTSAFDAEAENRFFNELRNMRKNSILVVVSHSPVALGRFDKTLEFTADGNVIETNSSESLRNKK